MRLKKIQKKEKKNENKGKPKKIEVGQTDNRKS
jgi:hypothetical protein